MTLDYQDGIYFCLPEDDYHAHHALSSSGIKWLRVSPLDFWVRSWMNPLREVEEDTSFMTVGRAYHKRIVEGKEAFYAVYAANLDCRDFPDALHTMDEIRERLKELGLKVGGNKPEITARLIEADPDVQVWDELVRDHEGDNAGLDLLSKDLIGRIELAAAMIEKHPQLCKAFTGGAAEVSIFWHDEETGVPMKARLDRFKARAIVDLKTFSNPLGKPIDRAIAGAVASQKYHVQCAVYQDAALIGARYIREGRVFGEVDKDVLTQLSNPIERDFLFVFQQTGNAPVARGKIMPRGLVFGCGQAVVREAINDYARFMKAYGDTPWVDPTEIATFDDADFPNYLTEI